MIESLLGSKNRERVLIFLAARKEGYANEIANFYSTSLSPVQNQLEKLEIAGVLSSKLIGRTRIYSFNPRYPFFNELKALLDKAFSFLPHNEKKSILIIRKRPRRKGKPL